MDTTLRKLVYQDEGINLYWDAGERCVESESRRVISSEHFRATLEKILEVLKEKQASKFLANMEKAENIAMEDLMWA